MARMKKTSTKSAGTSRKRVRASSKASQRKRNKATTYRPATSSSAAKKKKGARKGRARIVIAIIVVAAIAAVLLFVFKPWSCSTPESTDVAVDTSKEEGADGVSSGSNERSPKDSDAVQSQAEVRSQLANRGFEDVEISSDYDIDGNYTGGELDENASDKRPSYVVNYISADDVIWYMYINDGKYFAVPMAIGGVSPDKEVVLSETDYITRYDGTANTYSDLSFGQLGDVIAVKVDRIDRETLDSYTGERLESM